MEIIVEQKAGGISCRMRGSFVLVVLLRAFQEVCFVPEPLEGLSIKTAENPGHSSPSAMTKGVEGPNSSLLERI